MDRLSCPEAGMVGLVIHGQNCCMTVNRALYAPSMPPEACTFSSSMPGTSARKACSRSSFADGLDSGSKVVICCSRLMHSGSTLLLRRVSKSKGGA